MGFQEQRAQQAFAEETALITGGAASWLDPPEIRLEKVQGDGYLMIREPLLLERMIAPWSEAMPHTEVMLELKLPGNHLDRPSIERALFRRQARQLQRLEQEDARWLGDEPLWLVAPHVPKWLKRKHQPQNYAQGCYWVEQRWQSFLWIAANELPLVDQLIPFLMARSGKARAQFLAWAINRRSKQWMMNMVSMVPMEPQSREELLRGLGKTGDPVVDARRQDFLQIFLEAEQDTKQQLLEQGREEGSLLQARAALRRVLAHRQLGPTAAHDARIAACNDLATLERWLDQAIVASSAAAALE